MSKSKALVIMTGSIACYKACQVLSRLVQNDYEVQVVASASALEFVGNSTIEGLTGKPVISETHARGHAMDHIHLARWADIILVAPASANYINKIAQGVGDDLVTTLFLAHDFKKPFLVAPAMNTSMYLHPVTQASVAKLKAMGVSILETASGVLACGEVGWGRLIEPELIFQEINTALLAKGVNSKSTSVIMHPASAATILVTSGGTQEAIDDVRSITNTSTGRTGAAIAERLVSFGFNVIYLHGKNSILPEANCQLIEFSDFKSIQQHLSNILVSKNISALVQAAAISDFSIEKLSVKQGSQTCKISSDNDEIILHLKKNQKLLTQAREWSKNKKLHLIAFKMTAQANPEQIQQAVEKLQKSAQPELIIHNDLSQIKKDQHRFTAYNLLQHSSLEIPSRLALADYIGSWLIDQFIKPLLEPSTEPSANQLLNQSLKKEIL